MNTVVESMSAEAILSLLDKRLGEDWNKVDYGYPPNPKPERVAMAHRLYSELLAHNAMWPKPATLNADNTGTVEVVWRNPPSVVTVDFFSENDGLSWAAYNRDTGAESEQALDVSDSEQVKRVYDAMAGR